VSETLSTACGVGRGEQRRDNDNRGSGVPLCYNGYITGPILLERCREDARQLASGGDDLIMKSFLASLLALLVFHQALTAQAPQATDFAEMAKALGIGTKVEVQLVGGSHIRGRISAVQPDALRVYAGRPNAGKVRTIAFTNIVTLKRQPATHTPVLAWAAAGAIVAAVVIAISVLLIERRNESGLIQMPGDFRTDHVTAQASFLCARSSWVFRI
jgi:hypothetical protein